MFILQPKLIIIKITSKPIKKQQWKVPQPLKIFQINPQAS